MLRRCQALYTFSAGSGCSEPVAAQAAFRQMLMLRLPAGFAVGEAKVS